MGGREKITQTHGFGVRVLLHDSVTQAFVQRNVVSVSVVNYKRQVKIITNMKHKVKI